MPESGHSQVCWRAIAVMQAQEPGHVCRRTFDHPPFPGLHCASSQPSQALPLFGNAWSALSHLGLIFGSTQPDSKMQAADGSHLHSGALWRLPKSLYQTRRRHCCLHSFSCMGSYIYEKLPQNLYFGDSRIESPHHSGDGTEHRHASRRQSSQRRSPNDKLANTAAMKIKLHTDHDSDIRQYIQA